MNGYYTSHDTPARVLYTLPTIAKSLPAMKMLRRSYRLTLAGLCLARSAHELYVSAIDSFRYLPNKYDGYAPIYTSENVNDGVWIPPYDETIQNYLTSYLYKSINEAYAGISMLQQAMEAGSSDAASALGDIYTFGNFSVPVNYTKALSFYHKAVSLRANGHAYFMLGYMYSTGMFGELPLNKQKAAVYYDFAAKNRDFNAFLVLANKYYHGIGCALDCTMSKFYYAAAARATRTILAENDLDLVDEYLTYDVALTDYNGGIYGRRVSESPSSVSNRVSTFVELRESLRDGNLNSQDSNIVDYYFDAYENYHGSQFREKNMTQAYIDSLMCIQHGQNKFGGPYFDLATQIDRYIWSRCHTLVSRMHFEGLGVERNVSRGYMWLKKSQGIYDDKEALLTHALFHRLDPSYTGAFTDRGRGYMTDAATNGSAQAAFLLSEAGIAPKTPLQTAYSKTNYDLMKYATKSEIILAYFYYADAAESGYSQTVGDKYDCEHIAAFFKSFIERSEKHVLPHLKYAFDEFRYGNFKNALLGFLIAAEQGLANSQVSAAYLLHQLEPILLFTKKLYYPDRVRSSFAYLELASAQDHLDATILLGDLYSSGVPAANISADYSQAFAYYSKAALSASGHGCYKLGYMYEYGLGSPNNTVDYFMAKRYYDMSRKYYKDRDISQHQGSELKASTFPVTLALLRLRFKMLFSGTANQKEMESSGWFITFKKLTKSDEQTSKESASQAKAEAHLEGGTYDGEDEYETFDYVVLILTIAFFLYLALENIRGHFRRMGRHPNAGEEANPERAPRFRVEFFFAI